MIAQRSVRGNAAKKTDAPFAERPFFFAAKFFQSPISAERSSAEISFAKFFVQRL